MVNAKLAVRVTPDVVHAEAQFQRPVFQTLRLDEQSGHNLTEIIRNLRAGKMEVERKMNYGIIWSARTSPRFGTTRHVASWESGDVSPHSKKRNCRKMKWLWTTK